MGTKRCNVCGEEKPLERDDGRCGLCGGDVDPLDFHVDHVQPLAAGGLHGYFNVQAAHPACNVRTGVRG